MFVLYRKSTLKGNVGNLLGAKFCFLLLVTTMEEHTDLPILMEGLIRWNVLFKSPNDESFTKDLVMTMRRLNQLCWCILGQLEYSN